MMVSCPAGHASVAVLGIARPARRFAGDRIMKTRLSGGLLLAGSLCGIVSGQEPVRTEMGGPDARSTTDESQVVPHERPAEHPRIAGARPPLVSPPATVVRGPFISVQVNVDESGNNIVNDAANEPSIAIDPTDPDRIAIGWRQFDTIESDFRQAGYAYSRDGGVSWTFPGVLDPGQFRSDPVLGSDADGVFYYYSIRCPSSNCGDIFRSTDGGVSWVGPVFAYGGDKPWMAIDRTNSVGRGHVYVAWGSRFVRSTDGGDTFDGPHSVSATWGTSDVAPDGTVYFVGQPVAVLPCRGRAMPSTPSKSRRSTRLRR